MPTENRRVATYLPKELDSAFKAFKDERGIGDSAALILILSERLGVTHLVSQVDYSRFATVGQLEELAAKVSELAERIEKDSSVGISPDKIRQMAERLEKIETFAILPPSVEPSFAPKAVESVPSQMDLLSSPTEKLHDAAINETQPGKLGELLSESKSELKPLNGAELARRFGLTSKAVSNLRTKYQDQLERLTEYTRKKDPDGIAWQYNSSDKLYHPVLSEEGF